MEESLSIICFAIENEFSFKCHPFESIRQVEWGDNSSADSSVEQQIRAHKRIRDSLKRHHSFERTRWTKSMRFEMNESNNKWEKKEYEENPYTFILSVRFWFYLDGRIFAVTDFVRLCLSLIWILKTCSCCTQTIWFVTHSPTVYLKYIRRRNERERKSIYLCHHRQPTPLQEHSCSLARTF